MQYIPTWVKIVWPANVDRKPYPLSQALESGQTIDILTSPNARPNVAWLNFVVTAKARSSIRHALKDLRRDEAIESGRRQLAHALSPVKLEDLNLEYYTKRTGGSQISQLE